MKSWNTGIVVSWLLQLVAAGILLQTLFFKFTGASESVYIFSTLGAEPWGRIGSGIVELIASILLLVPATTTIGAALALGVISGAIVSHLTILGIEVQGDGGLLFILALIVFVASAAILVLRRAEIPIATAAQTTPQTHEAAESVELQSALINSEQIIAPASSPTSAKMVAEKDAPADPSIGAVGALGRGGRVSKAKGLGGGIGAGFGSGYGPGVYRASDALQEGDVSTSAFDDFFEYALSQPVTIHKNESAMVPILQQDLPAEHVTLWSRNNPRPLRAVWLENKSKLTLDSGSFSIFESGEFAGEGLLDPIHPGERRLLSYAADQAVRVRISDQQSRRTLHHLEIRKGLVIENHMDVASMTYSANNTGDEDRVVLIEHPRHTNGWSLDDKIKADDTTPDLYRFRVSVKPHATEKLEVSERGPEYTQVTIDPSQNTNSYLLDLVKRVPEAEAQLKSVLDAQAKLADLDQAIGESRQKEQTAAADEAPCRDNLTALKGNEAARRFVDELNRAEDLLQSTRKHTADLEQQKNVAVENLRKEINALNFNWDAKAGQ